jgi:hypothetical protein
MCPEEFHSRGFEERLMKDEFNKNRFKKEINTSFFI